LLNDFLFLNDVMQTTVTVTCAQSLATRQNTGVFCMTMNDPSRLDYAG